MASSPTAKNVSMLHSAVVDALGRQLAIGELVPGMILTADGIQDEYDVSRSVVREAFRVLESMGILAARRRIGTVVQPREDWNALDLRLIAWNLAGPTREKQLAELVDVRLAVEPIAARLCAQHSSMSVRDELSSLAADLRRLGKNGLGESDAYLTADVRFHQLVLEGSGNSMFSGLLCEVIGELLSARTHFGRSPAHPNLDAIAHHESAAKAIAKGEGASAESSIRAIVREAHEALLPAWRTAGADAGEPSQRP